MKVKLETDTFYKKDNFDHEKYKKNQIARWNSKSKKDRNKSYYHNLIHGLLKSCPKLKSWKNIKFICLGSRNAREKCHIKKYLEERNINSINVVDNDISGKNRDFMGDFCKLEIKDYNVVFTNSIDHASFPTEAYFKFLDYLKVGGILIVDFYTDKSPGAKVVNSSDCSVFSEDSINNFLNILEKEDLIKILKNNKIKQHPGMIRTIVKKKENGESDG